MSRVLLFVFVFLYGSKGINITTLASLTQSSLQPLSCMVKCVFELGPKSQWHTRIILNSLVLRKPNQNFYVYFVPRRLVDQSSGLGERDVGSRPK